jgi:hypothetical protein
MQFARPDNIVNNILKGVPQIDPSLHPSAKEATASGKRTSGTLEGSPPLQVAQRANRRQILSPLSSPIASEADQSNYITEYDPVRSIYMHMLSPTN